jgi:hypothetical protein
MAFAAVGSIAVLALAATSVRVSSPLLPPTAVALSPGGQDPAGTALILNGWREPDWRTVDAVRDLATQNQSLVLWDYFDPGNDRLGNFWLAAYDQLRVPTETFVRFFRWAADEDAVNLDQLCDLLRNDPARIVATRNSALPAIVRSRCGLSAERVWVAPT